MSGCFWVGNKDLSDEVLHQLASMTCHLSKDSIRQLKADVKKELNIYIGFKLNENNDPGVSKQKKEIENIFKLSNKLQIALAEMSQKTKDMISIHYQEDDLNKFMRLKELEQIVPDMLEEYTDLLYSGKNKAYIGITKNKYNPRMYFIKSIQKILNDNDIKTGAWTYNDYDQENPFHKLIRLLLEQTVNNPTEIPENIPEIKHIK